MKAMKFARTLRLTAAVGLALCTLVIGGTAEAQNAQDLQESFFPYKKGMPQVPGITPGLVINKGNVEAAKEYLDPAMYQFIKDGWVEVTVGATTDFPLPASYVKASEQNVGKVSVGPDGNLSGYVAGRPFPADPDPKDPLAGQKLAWNYKHGYNWGDSAAIYPFYWRFKNLNSGAVEREIKFNFHFLNFKHRVDQSPLPDLPDNPSNIFRGIYVQVLEPGDLKNTQLLILRYEDDGKRDDAWLYLGFQRRVRRLATGQVTDAFLGSDLMIEDFEGYNGRIADMKWTYKGTKLMLLPFYNHNDLKLATDIKDPDGYQFVDFGGKGGCFPNITWQLRKTYVLEAEPVDPAHPISKRIFHIDAQAMTIQRTLIYDRKGDLWKSWTIGKSHPDHHLPVNKGTGVAIDDAFSMIDVLSGHCTTGQFKGQVDPKLSPANMFNVQNMRAEGR